MRYVHRYYKHQLINQQSFSYMTKITDQIICLITPEEATTLVWKQDSEEDYVMDMEDESYDRLYTFEVAKTNEQEEGVAMRPGFEASIADLCRWPFCDNFGR
jgi:SPX domain protein involved in polyphosphate accumulation